MSLKKFLIPGIFLLVTGICGMQILKADVARSEKIYAAAEEYYEKGNLEEAYAAFLKINVFSPFYKPALFKQGVAAEKLEDYKTSEQKFQRLIMIFPEGMFTPRAEYSLAKAYYFNGKIEKAQKLFEKISEKSQNDDFKIAANYFLGLISEKNGKDLNKTKDFFLKYIENSPNGRYSLDCAYKINKLNPTKDEKIIISKIFFKNEKYFDVIKIAEAEDLNPTELAISYSKTGKQAEFSALMKKLFSVMLNKLSPEETGEITAYCLSLPGAKIKTYDDILLNEKFKGKESYLAQRINYLKGSEREKALILLFKTFPKGRYTAQYSKDLLLKFVNDKNIHAAQAVAAEYLKNFPGSSDEPFMLYWTGKCLLKTGEPEKAKKYFDEILKKYPYDYYAFRASRADLNGKLSLYFQKSKLPANTDIKVFATGFEPKDRQTAELLLSVKDYTIWEEIPVKDDGFNSAIAFKKGKTINSMVLAQNALESNSFIPENKTLTEKLAYPIYFSNEINTADKEIFGDKFLILSIIKEESKFSPKSVSSADAVGLMQMLPSTAEFISNKYGLNFKNRSNLFNPEMSVTLGTLYFNTLLSEFSDNIPYAVAAYNAGPGAVKAMLKSMPDIEDYDEFIENIPYPETRHYVKNVLKNRYNYEKIYNR